MKDIQDFDSIRIRLASPEMIKNWSYGEVKKPETINYRTLRPERDGLFCEKIFGTTKEWECYCGKFKSIRYKGVICERCGVEVTSAKVRRERMGHITLACPVSHIWYYRSTPSRIALILGINRVDLKAVLYYEKYIVLSPGDTDLKEKQVLSEEEYQKAISIYGEGAFVAEMGAEAIRELLSKINLDETAKSLRETLHKGEKELKGDSAKRANLLKRIEVVEKFRASGNRPEWMILTVIPVIPPDLRPMVQLDGGRFATSDLNDLYRRVINRNNRLRRLMELHAPETIIRNEKRLLQESVDSLFDNNSQRRVVKGSSNRPLKSLSDLLKGKTGRFRMNLLGKRTDYSGRSVIVIGPELRLHQCGLPSLMALELFKPFLIKRLTRDELAPNPKRARVLVENATPEVWSILDDVVKEHPVMLNRAPTLHRLSIQAFEPVLVDGKAIKLHPLVCHAFNADFDGDQMSVHVPLTAASQIECWTMMLSSTNLLDPANGKPIVFPTQDMVLGINYLTRAYEDEEQKAKNAYRYFDNSAEIQLAIDNKSIGYNTYIKYRLPSTGEKLITTPGRVLFNAVLPEGISFQNKCFGDKDLRKLIADTLKEKSNSLAVKLLDAIKDVGFKYATIFGATIGLSDMIVPENKAEIIKEATESESEISRQFRRGVISRDERYNKIVALWKDITEKLSDELMADLRKSQHGFNPLFLMADSGARGSKTQISQLGGMRGCMSRPNGSIIEFPIKSNFKEGLSIIEFFISTNGARKALGDTALKTSHAGHLTRRLVDVSQDVVITEDDCGTISGIEKRAVKKGDEVVISLADQIKGHYTLENVVDPITGEIIVPINEEISDEKAEQIEKAGIESVLIRTVLTCESKHGLCKKCYGRNLANNRPVEIGEAVGIIAAQSIGQPGTQLTMRTFHEGGVAHASAEDNKIAFTHDAIIGKVQGDIIVRESDNARLFSRRAYVYYSRVQEEFALDKYSVKEGDRVVHDMKVGTLKGKDVFATTNGFAHIADSKLYVVQKEQRIEIAPGSEFKSESGAYLKAGMPLVLFDLFSEPILTEASGTVEYRDIQNETTLIEDFQEESGEVIRHINEHVYANFEPSILIKDKDGNVLQTYLLPGGSVLQVDNGEEVKVGDILAKLPKESIKSTDITGGLPRIEELVEARHPQNAAVLAKAEGTVHFEGIERRNRVIFIEDDFGKRYKHLIPLSKHLLVRDKDRVESAEQLCDGAKDPHDILEILGENALQEFLVNQIQEVYRAQKVDINEKHCGIIIRQMLKRVRILRVGDTSFVQNQLVDKFKFKEENERVISQGGEPAVATPILQGITKASLSNSFIAAASFQETTKVLTNAAIAGSIDTLSGLKENVVIGHAIPAGTGMKCYKSIELVSSDDEDIDELIRKAQEKTVNDMDFDAVDVGNMTMEVDESEDYPLTEETDE